MDEATATASRMVVRTCVCRRTFRVRVRPGWAGGWFCSDACREATIEGVCEYLARGILNAKLGPGAGRMLIT